MINVPIWLFIILCAFGFIGLLFVGFVVTEIVSEMIYQKYEKEKFKDK